VQNLTASEYVNLIVGYVKVGDTVEEVMPGNFVEKKLFKIS
jgi:hypothetical protein